jgi:pimeloyl-ACP methyl ester carboxylesterase
MLELIVFFHLPNQGKPPPQVMPGGEEDSKYNNNTKFRRRNLSSSDGALDYEIGVVVLVHGFCSGDVWGPVARGESIVDSSGQPVNHRRSITGPDFTNFLVFEDFVRARTNDVFASLLKDFLDSHGLTYSSGRSCSIVAHSQGGMAALTLYRNYWTCLDNSQATRLIQTVGTPFQGSNLASVGVTLKDGTDAFVQTLANLGAIDSDNFHMSLEEALQECKVKMDHLSRSSAAAWLQTIPNTYRAKVWYRTTSFTDRSFRWDYCHVFTDLLLDDPDDGATEKVRGVLPGGNFVSHDEGWCHSVDWREPPQFQDPTYNRLMDSFAHQPQRLLTPNRPPPGTTTHTILQYMK